MITFDDITMLVTGLATFAVLMLAEDKVKKWAEKEDTDKVTKDEAKEKLIDGYCKFRLFCELYPDKCMKESCEIWMAIKALSPRPKGHWILLDDCSNAGYYCSECAKKVVREGWSDTVKKIKFCPNCGADMRGESDVQ